MNRDGKEYLKHFYHFGPFRLNATDRILFREDEVVRLAEKTITTLLVLVEGRGEFISKAQLMERVWPDVTVEENNLFQHIKALRKAFSDDPHEYIETVSKRGYRFVMAVTESCCEAEWSGAQLEDIPGRFASSRPDECEAQPGELCKPPSAASDLASPVLPSGVRRRWIVPVAGIGVAALIAMWFLAGPIFGPHPDQSRPVGRLLVHATSEGKEPIKLDLGQVPLQLVITPDGKKLYAIESNGTTVTVLNVADLRRLRTLRLPATAYSAEISRDGERLFIGTTTGVAVIDTETDSVSNSGFPLDGPVWDLTVTPDGEKLFLAMGNAGLKRVLIQTRKIHVLSDQVSPMFVKVDPSGRQLFVSYQHGGPGGREGHDVMEVYDTTTEMLLDTINGLPRVGGPITFSPQGHTALLDGWDACSIGPYDQVGCPLVPSHIFHLVRTADRKVVETLALPPDKSAGKGTYLPDGARYVFGGTSLSVMDVVRQAFLESFSRSGEVYGPVAITPGGLRAFVASSTTTDLLVFDLDRAECLEPSLALVNQYTGDGTLQDAKDTTSLTAVGQARFAPGFVGQAFLLEGKGYLWVDSRGACQRCGNAWTASLYVKFHSLSGEMAILQRIPLTPNLGFRLFKTEEGLLALHINDSSGTVSAMTSTVAVSTGTWYHLAVSSDGTRIFLFVNGGLAGQQTLPRGRGPLSSWWGSLYLGGSKDTTSSFDGLIDEVTFYARTLTPEEIQSGYRRRLSGPCKP